MLLSLGEFGLDRLPMAERKNFLPQLVRLYRDDPDPGIHAAAELLLRRWERDPKLKRINEELMTGKVEGQRQWYANRQGQTMVVVPRPEEPLIDGGKRQERRSINRSYAIASKEVTVAQFERFRNWDAYRTASTTGDCPVSHVTWYEAAAYCNWLS